MTLITNDNWEFYVDDTIANDPTKTVSDILEAAIPIYEYQNQKIDEQVGGKMTILSNSIRFMYEELCLLSWEDSTKAVHTKFFTKYEDIFKPLYESWLIPADLYEINKDNLALAYD